MFCPVFRFLRLALCVLALVLLGARGQGSWAEAPVSRETPEWSAEKRAKPVAAIAARTGGTCRLPGASQAAGSALAAFSAKAPVFSAAAGPGADPAPCWRARARRRQPGRRATSGVVRLLI
jgi:hypothetical protein